MNMKTIAGAVPAVLLCAGCASAALTSGELRRNHPEATTVCSPLPPELALERLRQAWQRCYSGPGLSEVTVPIGGVATTVRTAGGGDSMRVDVEGDSKRRTLLVRTPNGKIMVMADIESTAQCTAQVTARGWNAGWTRSANNTAAWLDNPEAPGPFLGCR
jgi:hypothetical protein